MGQEPVPRRLFSKHRRASSSETPQPGGHPTTNIGRQIITAQMRCFGVCHVILNVRRPHHNHYDLVACTVQAFKLPCGDRWQSITPLTHYPPCDCHDRLLQSQLFLAILPKILKVLSHRLTVFPSLVTSIKIDSWHLAGSPHNKLNIAPPNVLIGASFSSPIPFPSSLCFSQR